MLGGRRHPYFLRAGAEPLDRATEAVLDPDLRLPAQHLAGPGDDRAAPGRVIDRQGQVLHRRVRAGHPEHQPREVSDGELLWVAQVHRAVLGAVDHAHDAADEVIDIAETTRLAAVAINSQRVAIQRLGDEVRDNAAVPGTHPRAVRIEDPDYAGIDAVRFPVGTGQGLGESLGLVVHASRADRVDVAPVVLGLRVHGRITVDLAGGGKDETRAVPVGQPQRVLGPVAAHGQRLEGKAQVVRRGGRAGEVGNGVHRAGYIEGGADVGLHEHETGLAHQVCNVVRPAGSQVVHADRTVTPGHYRVTQMGTEETGATCHHDSHCFSHRDYWPGLSAPRPPRSHAAAICTEAIRR